MEAPQDFGTKLATWLQKTAIGSLIVATYFYFAYLLTTKREA